MSNKLRVGVIGVGYLGKFHARIYHDMPDVELVGVVDADESVARDIATKYHCSWDTRPDALLGQVDAVSIVVPTVHHLDVAAPYLQSGVHMLMEKPIASDLKAGQQLVELADKAGVVLQVGHLERYNSGLRELARRVDNPRFIEAHRLGTFVERATDVDVVTDLMIHDIDIVMSLVGVPVKSIEAVGIPVLTEHVDIANARMEFENGAVANVTASRVSGKRFRRIRVFGRARYISLDYEDQTLEMVAARPDPDGGRANIESEKLLIEKEPPLDRELEDFVRCVREGSKPIVDGKAGLEALRVAMMVKEKIAACQIK